MSPIALQRHEVHRMPVREERNDTNCSYTSPMALQEPVQAQTGPYLIGHLRRRQGVLQLTDVSTNSYFRNDMVPRNDVVAMGRDFDHHPDLVARCRGGARLPGARSRAPGHAPYHSADLRRVCSLDAPDAGHLHAGTSVSAGAWALGCILLLHCAAAVL